MSLNKYIVVPDIHGQIDQYLEIESFIKQSLLKEPDFHIVFLGDYIDRGQSGNFEYYDKRFNKDIDKHFSDIGSRQVIEKLFELEDYFINHNIKYTFLLGNHEDMFINNMKDLSQFQEKRNNANKIEKVVYDDCYNTFLGFTQNVELLQKTKDFFEKMDLYYCDDKNKLFFVHAGVNPDYRLDNSYDIDVLQSKKSDYLWIRDKFLISSAKLSHRVIFGHTPTYSLDDDRKDKAFIDNKLNIFKRFDRIGLDSGNYKTGYVNVLEINHDDYKLHKISSKGVDFSVQLDLL